MAVRRMMQKCRLLSVAGPRHTSGSCRILHLQPDANVAPAPARTAYRTATLSRTGTHPHDPRPSAPRVHLLLHAFNAARGRARARVLTARAPRPGHGNAWACVASAGRTRGGSGWARGWPALPLAFSLPAGHAVDRVMPACH
eukprot:COSAG02_NODE_10808_length_1855_cov_1.167426_2_plen_142_part_00